VYKYEDRRSYVFTERGVPQLMRIKDRANRLIREAGAAKLGNIIADETGCSWDLLACVDYLVELGNMKEIKRDCMAQNRVFISPEG